MIGELNRVSEKKNNQRGAATNQLLTSVDGSDSDSAGAHRRAHTHKKYPHLHTHPRTHPHMQAHTCRPLPLLRGREGPPGVGGRWRRW